MEERPDSRLVKLARKGDEQAFAQLVERYQERVYWAAYNMVRSREEAVDISQEAFLRVYRSLDRFDIKKRFYTWLYQIVVNLSIDHLRRRSVARSVSLDALGDVADDRRAGYLSDGGPGGGIEASELRQRVRNTIDKLPPTYRAVIMLRDIEGLSCKEIAGIVETTHATVRWRLYRARIIFRRHWEEETQQARDSGETEDELRGS